MKTVLSEEMIGKRFGKLEVIALSDKRAPRGNRTVQLWECRCDCGSITYKAKDILNNESVSMCNECAGKYAMDIMRGKAGYTEGTQISKIKSTNTDSHNLSGVRGVYYVKRSNKWRARIKFRGKLINLGTYTTIEEAAKARKRAEDEIFGEFLAQMGS